MSRSFAKSWTDSLNDLHSIMYRQEVAFMAVLGNEPTISRKIGPSLFFFFGEIPHVSMGMRTSTQSGHWGRVSEANGYLKYASRATAL